MEVTYHREVKAGEEHGKNVWQCQVHAGPKLQIRGSFNEIVQDNRSVSFV